jgi:hypothetical protein
MPLISLDQFVDKTLVAKKPVKIYRSPGGEIVLTVKPGLSVGRVYSWVGGVDKTPLHFMFYAPAPMDKIPYYAKYEPGAFDYDLLREQGIKTVAEQTKEKEEANKPTSEKIFDYVKKYALWAGLAYAAFLVFKEMRKK